MIPWGSRQHAPRFILYLQLFDVNKWAESSSLVIRNWQVQGSNRFERTAFYGRYDSEFRGMCSTICAVFAIGTGVMGRSWGRPTMPFLIGNRRFSIDCESLSSRLGFLADKQWRGVTYRSTYGKLSSMRTEATPSICKASRSDPVPRLEFHVLK